ncbi:adenosylcobinamide-GDP ribazoletransferase [Rhodococcus rhodnii]|uniref:Adenosylcobinamide-GDP ribazoletransferase n=2 Tax=Rhodococcus rhodnii TaxID=38312 RepID=R7WVJ5_9NOCA|nr:adenosylcobinamide-GDP ribazoletransferase [Rhodococcus rhodnii]EOM78184.1 cobalamin synthase [Rhodococcus rhodnii LMG 5362]TXG91442.1 adenosylcobinamide-GDP ribazoletransferase [Rhodococcus rhodnii]
MTRLGDAGRGVALSFSWLTVLPVRSPSPIDRRAAGRAITAAPLTALVLGAGAAAIASAASLTALPPLAVGLLVAAALALASRGMHLDGLADVADGLGVYGTPERTREVARSGSSGPFAVVTLVVVLVLQATAFGALASRGEYAAVALAVVVGRVSAVIGCRRGIPAATASGFGALVAGTQPWPVVVAWVLAAAAAGVAAAGWTGLAAVVVGLAVAEAAGTHAVRRFGGLVGDVLGAGIELAVVAAALTVTM